MSERAAGDGSKEVKYYVVCSVDMDESMGSILKDLLKDEYQPLIIVFDKNKK